MKTCIATETTITDLIPGEYIQITLFCKKVTRSRIHEHTISLVPGHNLKILRLEVSLYNVCTTNQFQATFAGGGGGGVSAFFLVDFNCKVEKN